MHLSNRQLYYQHLAVPANVPEALEIVKAEGIYLHTDTGEKYIDLTLPDTSGSNISISDFDGMYRYVDFWAAWCPPCRQENPNLVVQYNKYKDHNFIIIGVSLDNNRTSWVNGINNDGLIWPQMSDLLEWNSLAVSTYDLTYIPSSILIDPDGIIIAKNLKGEELNEKLQEIFGE